MEYQTPPEVCDYMVSLIPKNVKTILEPTPGMGNLVTALKKKDRFKITAPKDYFLLDPKSKYDCIIMNPPFSVDSANTSNAPKNLELGGMRFGYYMLQEAMRRSEIIIALMPWFTLIDSDVRTNQLFNWGFKNITTLPRSTFGYSRIQTCILFLQRGWTEPTIFKNYEKRNFKSL